MKWVAWMVLASAWAMPARADDLTRMTITPWDALDGEARPYRYIVELRAERAVEAVVDRRLIELEIHPTGSRRRHLCRHPRARASAAAARSRALGAGGVWGGWFDVRMYCAGRALSALESGAEVRPRYGWRRGTSRRWVARVPETPQREWTAGITPVPFTFPPLEAPSTTVRHGEDSASPIEVVLSPTSASSLASLRFHVAVRARDGSERVYLRPEAFSFRVRGPDGELTCGMDPWGGAPVVDLYRRVTHRFAWHERLDARALCPEGAFARPGVYEVAPEVQLDHDGAEWGLTAVTGSFVGPTVAFRVLDGAYVEQRPVAAGAP